LNGKIAAAGANDCADALPKWKRKKMVTVYLSLGSNVGEREANLRKATASLADVGVQVTKVSSFYETEPVDLCEQPWFLNCVVEGETGRSAVELLRALRGIESRMGSEKLVAKGPRLMDVDILLYGSETINTPELQVPHPRMLLRRFVLVPLAEVAPTFQHPSWTKAVSDLAAATTDRSEVRKL
jgi:2-amino-4-hydroxy-6-hydroxymethyldihydropteridine diphosphokinase